jgi:anti-anti-sigma factor
MAAELKATVRRRAGLGVVDLEGDVDRNADAALNAAWEQAAVDGDPVLLNFEKVGYINSTGIAIIVSVLARARAQRKQLAAYGLSEHYRQIFSITRLSDFVHLYNDEDSAISDTAPGEGGPVGTAQGGTHR